MNKKERKRIMESQMRFSANVPKIWLQTTGLNGARFNCFSYYTRHVCQCVNYRVENLYLLVKTIIDLNPDFSENGTVRITSDDAIVWKFKINPAYPNIEEMLYGNDEILAFYRDEIDRMLVFDKRDQFEIYEFLLKVKK